jgi:hypothetical protein
VRPILASRCTSCHGGGRQRGGLDLRNLAALLRGGDSGPAFQPGNAAASPLWKSIARNHMPPGRNKLSAEQKDTIRAWIVGGARP